MQIRECDDTRNCHTTRNKPAEAQECEEDTGDGSTDFSGNICPEPGKRLCAGDNLFECNADQTEWVKLETCENGCEAGACITTAELGTGGGLVGMFLSNPITMGFGVIVAIIIIAGLGIVWKYRK